MINLKGIVFDEYSNIRYRDDRSEFKIDPFRAFLMMNQCALNSDSVKALRSIYVDQYENNKCIVHTDRAIEFEHFMRSAGYCMIMNLIFSNAVYNIMRDRIRDAAKDSLDEFKEYIDEAVSMNPEMNIFLLAWSSNTELTLLKDFMHSSMVKDLYDTWSEYNIQHWNSSYAKVDEEYTNIYSMIMGIILEMINDFNADRDKFINPYFGKLVVGKSYPLQSVADFLTLSANYLFNAFLPCILGESDDMLAILDKVHSLTTNDMINELSLMREMLKYFMDKSEMYPNEIEDLFAEWYEGMCKRVIRIN